jgi:hypothetical protein
LLSGWVSFVGGTVDLDKMEITCAQTLDGALCSYAPERSSLWAPFLSFPRLSTGETVFTAYVAFVVAYLASAPTLAILRLLRQLRPSSWTAGWRI